MRKTPGGAKIFLAQKLSTPCGKLLYPPLDTGKITEHTLNISKNFYVDIMGNMEGLSPLRQAVRVTGEGGSALVPIGTFQVNISFPRLLDWPTMELKCCVYENLSSDVLMVRHFFKK